MSAPLPAIPKVKLLGAARLSGASLARLDALLVVVPARDPRLAELPHGAALAREHARRERAPGTAWSTTLPLGAGLRVVVGVAPERAEPFDLLALAGRMVREIAPHEPRAVGLAATHAGGASRRAAPVEALCAAVLAAAEPQPTFKSRPPAAWRLERVVGFGPADLARTAAVEAGAHLVRWLTVLPPNVLTPGGFRDAALALARRRGWKVRVLDERALARAGAGAFLAVARGSASRDAALVHLEYAPAGRAARAAPVALVGKGVCFDTGGTNLKQPKPMLDMHGDMGGAAVALGLLDALTALAHPRPVHAWLALAENRPGPAAYVQQEVVTAANGTTIQVIHTDAEGRMLLADALALAGRTRPACILDFATLTGACVAALTERYSGAFTNRPELRDPIEAAGRRAGERVWTFPTPPDFDEELESKVADVRQCLIDGKGDHIYAARFLQRFVPDGVPWVHVDLASAQRTGGLAHVARDVTGFGVRFGAELLAEPRFLAALAGRGAGRAGGTGARR